MAVHPIRSEASLRGARMLRTALGASIAAWLDDPQVIEIMLNPDGRLWVDRLSIGVADSGVAKIVAVIVIITTGLTLAFGDTSGGFRRLIQIVFGLSIAFAASSFFLQFFSFGGWALV
jgi:hypothetical protein